MTSEIVNLRQARKARARADREKTAEENRLKFGRSKAEKKRDEMERRKAGATLDGHLRSIDPNDEGSQSR